MPSYDRVDETVIETSSDVVWKELLAELSGGGQWWVPHNTFAPGALPVHQPGATVEVTVYPNGVDHGGPALSFTARTRMAVPSRRLLVDYVAGVFRGTGDFTLTPLNGGRQTRLRMHFAAAPQGPLALLSKVKDIGEQHSTATREAFANLAALAGDFVTEEQTVLLAMPCPTESTARTLRTGDGATLAMTVLRPVDGRRGVTAVLAHGWAANRRIWCDVTNRLLCAGISVVSYDQRGHGDSTLGAESVSPERLGADLSTVLDEFTGQDVIVVGHSGGGFAALALAGTGLPESVRGLVLLATAAYGQRTPESEVRMMGNRFFSSALSHRRLGRLLLRGMHGKGASRSVRELNRQLFSATERSVRADYFACTADMDLRDAASRIGIPTVVLAGAEDTVVDSAFGEELAGAIPGAQFQSLSGIGHLVPLEDPDAIALAVDQLARP